MTFTKEYAQLTQPMGSFSEESYCEFTQRVFEDLRLLRQLVLPKGAVSRTLSSATTVADSTWVTIEFDQESFETDPGLFDLSTDGEVTFNESGIYLISVTFRFAADANGSRWGRLRGSSVITQSQNTFVSATLATHIHMNELIEVEVGDTYDAQAFQTSGGDLDVETGHARYGVVKMN